MLDFRPGIALGLLGTVLLASPGAAAPIVFSGNGHYYDVVIAPNIRWDHARDAAQAISFQGKQGYLATITSAQEQAFLVAKFGGIADLWVGGSDLASEKNWFWVTGPETGVQFYSATLGPVGFVQPGFNGGDNDLDEDYLVWNHLGGNGGWNDYGLFGRARAPGSEPLNGFLVEFDPVAVAAVPEPSTFIILAGALTALLFFSSFRGAILPVKQLASEASAPAASE